MIAFGVVRIYAVEAGIKQPKFFFFKWAGSSASLKRKVLVNAVKTQIQMYFTPVHASVETDHIDDITEEVIIAKLLATRGSHKPQRWEFGTGNPDEEEDEEREAREKIEREIEDARLAEEARIAAEAAAEVAKLEEEARILEEAC